jgi:DNA-binding GntR family transcriptional regulator
MAGWDHTEITPIRDKVFEYIKNAILQGELKAGERIVERDLAEKLHISRTPIREALFRLESLGFVKTLPRKGVVVSRMTSEEIIEVFTILSTLQGLAVKLAAQKLNSEHQKNLEQLIHRIDRFLEEDHSSEDSSQLHLEIIDTILRAAQSPRLYEMLTSLFEYIRAFAHVSQDSVDHRKRSFEEHREIATAILSRNGELAESLTKIHIENSKKTYFNLNISPASKLSV